MSKYPDISHHHPVTDWGKVKANAAFLISKATQGTAFIDNTLNSFIANCESYGIPYWLYAYLNKGNELAQAKYMVSTCKGRVGDLFAGYVLDVEAGNNAANVKSALDYLESLGGKCGVYTMYAEYGTYKDVIAQRGADTFWWEARYGKNDGNYSSSYPCHPGVDLHQYTSAGSCAGISGKIDLNRLTGAKAESWFTGAAQAATTATQAQEGGVAYMFTATTVKNGTKNNSALLLQEILRAWKYKGKDGKALTLDGDCGANTVYAINAYQTARRKQGTELGSGGKNDGTCGAKMWADLLKL